MKLICVACQVEFKPEKNEQVVFEMAGQDVYKIWSADRWKCPGCHRQIVGGFANQPWAVRGQPGFEELVDKLKATEYIIHDYEQLPPIAGAD